MISKIEIDLDGVLLDWAGHYKTLFGHDISSVSKKVLWDNVHNCIGFYSNIPLTHDGLELFNFCINTGIPTEILTATGNFYERVTSEKTICVRNSISASVIVKTVPQSADKAKYATPTSILIDDQLKSINPWKEAGGIGILHTSTKTTIDILKQIINNETRCH